MYSIEIKKTGEVMGVECFIINQVYTNDQGQRAVIRRLGQTVTRKAVNELSNMLKKNMNIFNEETK